MIPISDDNPVQRTPFVTWLLIGGCVLVYVWEFLLGREMDGALNVLGFIPASLHDPSAAPSEALGIPPFGTIFISMFLHGSVLTCCISPATCFISGSSETISKTRWGTFAS